LFVPPRARVPVGWTVSGSPDASIVRAPHTTAPRRRERARTFARESDRRSSRARARALARSRRRARRKSDAFDQIR